MGGAPGCEGAILWQCSHFFRVVLISADMPGQNTENSARAVIIDMPWRAACRVLSTSPRSEDEEEEEEDETLFDPKCTINHISDAKLDIKQYTHMFTHICTYMHTCTYTYIINTKTI